MHPNEMIVWRELLMHSASRTVSALILALAIAARAQSPASPYTERLDPILEQIVREQNLPGLAIGVVKDGRLVYSRGVGTMETGAANKPVTPETLFHMASITKPFVATAVMQLAEQGKIDLDSPVTRYVPYFRLKDDRYRLITVRQMLTHTSGMPDVDNYQWDKPEYDDGALERYVRSLQTKQLRWDPGTRFAYSNMAFEVLGDLVAKVSGASFERYAEAQILKPLGMSSSTLLFKEASPSLLAAGHTKNKQGAVKVISFYPYNRAHTPSSNLHSNVLDMARWTIANLNGGELDGHRILKTSTHDLMWTNQAEAGGRGHVGLSWFINEVSGEQIVLHGGAEDGFLTNIVLLPARKLGVIYMTNCDYARMKDILLTVLSVVAPGFTAK